MSVSEADLGWMAQALALGALAEGGTSPNPRVGCLVVRDDRVVGFGCHRAAGQPHAEALALTEAGRAAEGATLYVNLEPCAHHGRTPPCTDRVIRSGVRRVVAAMRDPDPRVDGRGFTTLRDAGVAVDVGVREAEAQRLNASFVHWHRHGLPRVTLKAAVSMDGMLAARGGSSRWITGRPARRFGHRLRFRSDAILVGAGTVRRDDPSLTVRLPGVQARRPRVILSGGLELDPGATLFRRDPAAGATRVYHPDSVDASARLPLERRAELIGVDAEDGRVDLRAVLRDLAAAGVQSVLVEGGGKTLAGFLEAGLAQEMALFVSRAVLGSQGGIPLVDAPAVEEPARGWRMEPRSVVPLGQDLLFLGPLHGPPSSNRGG